MINTVDITTEIVDSERIEDMERQLAASELRYQRLSKGLLHRQDGTMHVTEEMDVLHWIDRMDALAKRIASTEVGATKLVKLNNGPGHYSPSVHELTPLGREVRIVCNEATPLLESLYPGCRIRHGIRQDIALQAPRIVALAKEWQVDFNPHITVLLRAFQRARAKLRMYDFGQLDVNVRLVRLVIERIVFFVRRVCLSTRFKAFNNGYIRNEKENFKSCCRYIAQAFLSYSKLLISRVDLYYPPDTKGRVDVDQAEKCARLFLRALREQRIVPDVKAWICRREKGVRRGIHYHVFVAMDGHMHREAATYSRIIGEAWVARFTKKHGTYYNCWARRNEYPFNGLGLVHVRDRAKLMGIREAIRYITKGAYHVKTGFKRNLWRGITRMPLSAVKRGAPRKDEHDMAIVVEVLGKV